MDAFSLTSLAEGTIKRASLVEHRAHEGCKYSDPKSYVTYLSLCSAQIAGSGLVHVYTRNVIQEVL